MNAARTVQILEEAGVAGMHVEDQVNPKRCGHPGQHDRVREIQAAQHRHAGVARRQRGHLPGHLLRLAMHAAEGGLAEIASRGTQEGLLDRMQHRRDLYDLLDYEAYNAFDTGVYNFRL
jgi:2-methylisocitrate lyase-like PEP mutase family enzyme